MSLCFHTVCISSYYHNNPDSRVDGKKYCICHTAAKRIFGADGLSAWLPGTRNALFLRTKRKKKKKKDSSRDSVVTSGAETLSLWRIFFCDVGETLANFFASSANPRVTLSRRNRSVKTNVTPEWDSLLSSNGGGIYFLWSNTFTRARRKGSFEAARRWSVSRWELLFFLGGWDVEQSPVVISCRYNQIISKEAVGAHRKWNKEANLHLSALSNIIMCQQTQANSLAEKHYGFCFLINKIETFKTPSTLDLLSIIYFLTFLTQWCDADEHVIRQRDLQGRTVWFLMLDCKSIQWLQ